MQGERTPRVHSRARQLKPPEQSVPCRSQYPCVRTALLDSAAFDPRVWVMRAAAAFRGGVSRGPRSHRTTCGLTQFPACLALGLGSRHGSPAPRASGCRGQGPVTVITSVLPVPARAFDTTGSGLGPEEKERFRHSWLRPEPSSEVQPGPTPPPSPTGPEAGPGPHSSSGDLGKRGL